MNRFYNDQKDILNMFCVYICSFIKANLHYEEMQLVRIHKKERCNTKDKDHPCNEFYLYELTEFVGIKG